MKVRQLKTRDRFGNAKRDDYTDLTGLIELTRHILADDPGNLRARVFLAWVDGLDHAPTDSEFATWMQTVGVRLMKVERERDEN